GFPGPMQHRTRPAADIKHGPHGHHQFQVEVEVASSLPRAKHIIQRGETGIGEQAIDHYTSSLDGEEFNCELVESAEPRTRGLPEKSAESSPRRTGRVFP